MKEVSAMKKILVLGASGFVGRRVAQALLADGYGVRCLARDPARVQDLAQAGGEIVQGDLSDAASVRRALDAVDAAYIERAGRLPKGAMKGLTDGTGADTVGDPLPIRALLPRPPLSYRAAVQRALKGP